MSGMFEGNLAVARTGDLYRDQWADVRATPQQVNSEAVTGAQVTATPVADERPLLRVVGHQSTNVDDGPPTFSFRATAVVFLLALGATIGAVIGLNALVSKVAGL